MSKVSISQAWDETRAIVVRDGKLIATVALALIVLPGVVLNVFMPRSVNLATGQQLTLVIFFFLILVVTFTGQLAIFRMAMGPHISVGEAIRKAASRLFPFVGAFFIWVVPVLVLTTICYGIIRNNPSPQQVAANLGLLGVVIVGTFFAVRLMLIGPIAIAEPGGSLAILARSWAMTAGNWWRLFGFLLIFGVGAIALLWAVNAALGVVAHLMVGAISALSVPGLILILIGQMVTAAVSVVLFVMQARIFVQLAGKAINDETSR